MFQEILTVCVSKGNKAEPLVLVSHRSELVAQVTCMRKSWLSSVALVGQSRSLMKEQLSQWKAYRRGLKLLWKLLREADPLLPHVGPPLCALCHSQSSMNDYQVSPNRCQHLCIVLLIMCLIISASFITEQTCYYCSGGSVKFCN